MQPSPRAIAIASAPDGTPTYAIPVPPEALPPVRPRELVRAWDAARAAADASRWGPPRRLLFRRAPGETTTLDIADRDARCWAEAVDVTIGLDHLTGLATCLRLLALVEVMTRASWLAGLFDVSAGGIELHPALLNAAATLPLDAAARFDAEALRGLLSRRLEDSSPARSRDKPLGSRVKHAVGEPAARDHAMCPRAIHAAGEPTSGDHASPAGAAA